jgi:hypothetical protein
MIFLWVPETKQRTLEELDYIFAVPTMTHMRYQLFQAAPWWFNRFILRRKVPDLEPLYKFEKLAQDPELIERVRQQSVAVSERKKSVSK